jgi:folate-binding protein YgfZ
MDNPRLYDRAVIRLSASEPSEDVRGFLQGLVTQDSAAEFPLWAGLLTPQGKALFDFILWADHDDVLIDCEADQAEALVRRLSIYRLRRKITIAIDPDLAVYWSSATNTASPEPVEGRVELNRASTSSALTVAKDPRLAALGVRWIAPKSDEDEDASAAFRAHRLSLGVAEGVAELGSDATLWLEANAAELNGVSFTKGCYVGQENTARMNWRQKVNRRLAVVPIADADAKRVRASYTDLGLAVVLERTEGLNAATLPDWQKAALA